MSSANKLTASGNLSEDDDEASSDFTADCFAEEYRLKQEKMLGELQNIYDQKTGLSLRLS